MAFLGQLTAKLNEVRTQLPLNSVLDNVNRVRQNVVNNPVFSKCTQQLDSLGKILQVNVNLKQSPIDLLPLYTAFDPALEGATFRFDYDETAQCTLRNLGSCLFIKYPDGASDDLGLSFLPEEQFHLDHVNFHWGTEPMNGSEHTVGGVGYAGEVHFVHRNLKYTSLELAAKQPDGIVALSVFLNEAHGDNLNLIPLTNILSNVPYNGNESALLGFKFKQILPPPEKCKEFWVYEGSETIEPFRELVKWVVFRSAIPISSEQLEKLRQLNKTHYEDEVEAKMTPIRPMQQLNGRIARSSFKSVAQAELS